MKLPEHVNRIIHRLQKEGYDAYAVGGCVRDTLLGREPKDWDITTSARPEIVKSLFSHTIDTGIQHGTVTIMLDHVGYEVTTYRIDGEYEDSRHPKEVIFTGNLVEDLKRRDFTMTNRVLWMLLKENRILKKASFAVSGIRMIVLARMHFECYGRFVLLHNLVFPSKSGRKLQLQI